jgi:hypothetical protein
MHGHATAGRLLAIPQSRIEYINAVVHQAILRASFAEAAGKLLPSPIMGSHPRFSKFIVVLCYIIYSDLIKRVYGIVSFKGLPNGGHGKELFTGG